MDSRSKRDTEENGQGVPSSTPNPAIVDAGELQEEGLNSQPLPALAVSETQAGVRWATVVPQQSSADAPIQWSLVPFSANEKVQCSHNQVVIPTCQLVYAQLCLLKSNPKPRDEQRRPGRAKGTIVPWQGSCAASREAGEAHQPPHLLVSIPCALTHASSRIVALPAEARHVHCMNTFPSKVTFRWLGVEEFCSHLGWGPAHVANSSSLQASPWTLKNASSNQSKNDATFS